MPGNAHWKLQGSVNTWESYITLPQLTAGEQAITDFKANVPNYTTDFQCTTAALSIAKKAGLTLPDGVGPVIAEELGQVAFSGSIPNPYHLNKQMTALFGPPQVVSASSFPSP